MAEVIRFINYASTPGGDGTTNNTTGATRAYATTQEWESAEQTDLPSDGDFHRFIVTGGAESENVLISGWTTNATANYIIGEVALASRHNGIPGSGFSMTSSVTFNATMRCLQAGTIFIGFEFLSTGNQSSGLLTDENDCMVIDCLSMGSGSSGRGFDFLNRAVVINCIAFDGVTGFRDNNFVNSQYYNCTAGNNSSIGFTRVGGGGTGPKLNNCVAFGNGTDYTSTVSYTAGTTNNSSEDLTSPGTSNVTGLVSGDFVDEANNDYAIPDNSSALYNIGTDLSATFASLSRTDFTILDEDIIGTPRPQSTNWDGGAFELPVGGVPLITPDPISNLQTISSPTLTQQHVFAVDNISTLQTVSNTSFVQQNTLSVNDLDSLQDISNVSLTVAGAINVNDLSNVQTITEPTLTQAHILSVDNIETGQTLSNVLLSVAGALEVQGLTQEQVISNVELVQQHLLSVDDLSQVQTLSNVILSVEGVLSVDSILSEQTISNSDLITQVALLVDNITNQQFISVVSFDAGQEIGTVTAAFKESDISVKYGIINITVKFKE